MQKYTEIVMHILTIPKNFYQNKEQMCYREKQRTGTEKMSIPANFAMYDYLPNAVLVFRSLQIEYINSHLLEILNISCLDKATRVEVLLKTLDLDKEETLMEYFMQREYFVHKNKIIQIEHKRHGKIDIFSFMLLMPSLLRDELEQKLLQPASPLPLIDEKIAKLFKLKEIKKVKILTFFKGLPLKNLAKIVRIGKESIELEVDKKHTVSLLHSDEIFLITDERKGAKVLRGHVLNHDDTHFTIKNFSLTDRDKHLREEIRIKVDDVMPVHARNRAFSVYDLSEKGISLHVKSEEDVAFLEQVKHLTLRLEQENVDLDARFFKPVYQEGKVLKVVFKTSMTDKNFATVKHYLTAKQTEYIREIHAFLNEKILQ